MGASTSKVISEAETANAKAIAELKEMLVDITAKLDVMQKEMESWNEDNEEYVEQAEAEIANAMFAFDDSSKSSS